MSAAMPSPKLSYVSDDVLYREVAKVLGIAEHAVQGAEVSLYRNVIDPFSAVFDALRQGISLTDWLEQEKARQIQKTMQNAVGDFHQAILGNIAGWEDLGVGNLFDVRNEERKIFAELKNKHNTTKGNHKKVLYDDLLHGLRTSYPDYTGYYVEVIAKSKKPYDKPFTPPDNETGERRPLNEKIRVIDGRSFYALVTGNETALQQLYDVLPTVIAELLHTTPDIVTGDHNYSELFQKAYPTL